jgi:hypothetical protein
MAMSAEECRCMVMVIGNHMRVSATRSGFVAHAQTR